MVLGLAIASAVSLGVADYMGGVALRRDGRMDSVLTYSLASSIVGVVVVVAALPVLWPVSFSRPDVLWSGAAGVAFGLAFPLLMIGMARGPIAIVAPVLGLVSLSVPAIAGPLLGDQLSVLEFVGLVVAVPATFLIASSSGSAVNAFTTVQAIAVGAAAGGLLGSAAVFFGQTSTDSAIAPAVVAQIIATLLLLTAGTASGRLLRPRVFALQPAMLVGALAGLAVLLSVLAYQRGPVAIVAAVIGLAPGPTVLLAWLLIKERINHLQGVGFALGVAAVVLFAFG